MTRGPAANGPRQASSRLAAANLNAITVPQSLYDEAPRKEVVEKIQSALATPIAFYGKVIDQNGDSVPGATVNYGALDKFDAPGSQYQGKSDANGHLSINGIGGVVLNVGVRKEGYYMIDGKSANAFAYGVGPDSTRRQAPTKDNPATFVLQKMGITEPLIPLSTGGVRVPKDGTPVSINLATGQRENLGLDGVKVEVWTDDRTTNAKGHYDWRCRVSVPGGGLLERKEQFDFEAPAVGYEEFDEIAMESADPSWRKRFKKDYFARLPSGSYARFQVEFTSGGDHFFIVKSYLNPNPGSRNLEFDPNKVVQP